MASIIFLELLRLWGLLFGLVLLVEQLTLLFLFSLDLLHKLLIVSVQFFSLVVDKVDFLH